MRTRRGWVGIAVPLVVAGLAAGCGGGSFNLSNRRPNVTTTTKPAGGDIPDTQVYVPFSPPSGGYTLQVPDGWSRTNSPTGVTFTDGLNTIRIDTAPAAAAPDVNTVRASELPALRAASPGFQFQDVISVQRPAGTAVLVTYLDDGPADPVTSKQDRQAVQRYEFWRNGIGVTLTLVSPVKADNIDPWRKVTASFAWQA